MIFPVQIFINSDAKIFNIISGAGMFPTKFNLKFIVYLFSLVFKYYQLGFLHI